jgi:hypothetical protein
MNSIAASNWGSVEVLGMNHISTLPRYWLTRIYVALNAGATAFTTWNEPEALTQLNQRGVCSLPH